ncbi:MAG: hypothetical protein ACP5LQ_09605, partial [Candidatus Methanodesulfokora sp.]
EAEKEMGDVVTISPLIVTQGDPAIDIFLKAAKEEKGHSWRKAVEILESKLSSRLGEDLLMIAALEEEEPLIYESNVLVVVRERREDIIDEVIRAKREAEKEMGDVVTISPLIVTQGDPAIDIFLKATSLVKKFEH